MKYSIRKLIVVLFVSFFAILQYAIVHAEPTEISVICTEHGFLEMSDNSEDLKRLFSDASPGDKIEIRMNFKNEFKSGNSDYTGFYLKAYTDTFDPEEEYSYYRWKNEYDKVLEDIIKIDQEENPDDYNECVNKMTLLSGQINRNTFEQEDHPEKELFFDALKNIALTVESQDNHTMTQEDLTSNGLLSIGKVGYKEECSCIMVIDIPRDYPEEDLEELQKIHLELCFRILGNHPEVSIQMRILNHPENGRFFLPCPEDEDSSADSFVNYQVRILNEGNVPVKLGQLRVGDSSYFVHEDLAPGQTWEPDGWYSVTKEDANQGEVDLTARFEGIWDNPDMQEHLIVTDSAQFQAGTEKGNDALNTIVESDIEEPVNEELNTLDSINEGTSLPESISKQPGMFEFWWAVGGLILVVIVGVAYILIKKAHRDH